MSQHNIQRGRLAEKTALITGAASGIGKATAILLAHEGAKVAVADIDKDGAQNTVGEIVSLGGTAVAYALDVTSEQEWQRVIDDLLEKWGRLDILVNNAGISFAKPLVEMSLAEWRKVFAVNLDGVFLGTKHGTNAMRKGGGGSIINVASASGIKAGAGASAYCASKAAVRMFSKVAALECAQNGDNIRVNTVSPGGVMTQMWESMGFWQDMKAQTGSAEANWQAMSQDVPLKRFAKPEEIAAAILYLASDESAYVTAAELVIDGGYTA
ncbi:glucose 1-dehydrogenase [candidate division KSB1 bacterium]|nr:glucose 1-dehydrogenase [candidate division KSB1 bacterium]